MSYLIGVDTGGTFTDLVIIDERGQIIFDKAFSTPANPAEGVMAALDNCSSLLERPSGSVLAETHRFCHGTTVGTNALIQRRGARVGLITTRGFEDIVVIARGPMRRNFGVSPSQSTDYIHNEPAELLVPKALIRGVAERVAIDGRIVAPLVESQVVQALEYFAAEGVESIAVCLLWSFRDAAHEQRIKQLAHEILPGVRVSLSSEVAPLLGEFERSMTTLVNAYVGPVLVRYVHRLQGELETLGLRNPVQLMTCSGGLTLPRHVEKQAVSLVNSGPIGGLVAAGFVGRLLGHQNIITTDMGGTSFDVGVIYRGELAYEQIPALAKGIPVQVPAAKVVTIGAGGGSIAWTDGRRLLVGPRSAGADPGPASYNLGGSEPTVTDALLVLGLLDPDYFFGGRRKLHKELAEAAIRERVARPLGLDVREAAAGIYEIVTAKMADLIRKVSVESGFDPREFALFAYGGAGGAHASLFAESLGVREVVIPWTASVFSALGCALSDILYSYAKSEPMLLEDAPVTLARLEREFLRLKTLALADMQASGFRADEVTLARRLDLRYEGQMHELTIGVREAPISSETIHRIRGAFEEIYEQRYGQGTSRSASPLEAITFRVDALKLTEKPILEPEAEGAASPAPALKGQREMYLRHTGPLTAAVYHGLRLTPGNRVRGPAIVERPDTTIVILPNQEARVDGFRNIRLQIATSNISALGQRPAAI